MPDRVLERYAGMSILIVDDDVSNVALLEALLAEQGMHRTAAETDPRNVHHRLVEERPDLILLDLHMPHLDGHQVLTLIKEYAAGNYLPVLIMTANTTTAARDLALSAGADDFLTKPIDTMEAALRIANLLQTRCLYATLRTQSAHALPPTDDEAIVRTRIEEVIGGEGLLPVFQPVVDLTNGLTVGCEGLSRFVDTRHGGPDRWFSDAFMVGLGVELEWRAASLMLPHLDRMGHSSFLAVNMSPATVLHLAHSQLCDSDLCSRIVIEITEHVPVEDYRAIHHAMDEMRSNGARLSADDLGAGYAGFRHLINLHPDIIKLDMSLVRGIDRNDAQQALARAMLTFADDIGATVIAEGIEEATELDVLREMGVPWGQGYYLGPPAPVAS